ncbi:putative L-ascorbate peroxidase 3-like [Hibiscus syriacus]|uniref:L-ascorbate peroxidase 3-like n=1 Tax=Hibiscus syriacus TaxID=106335 RepID=A0A6A2ZRF4_HIBSY|nr:protein ALTERED PHOSPHATE STARVATION RESPONSE 1-like [Hibiscus syriacus]KAE8693475.1 putative L-ascorbate peroxidase 3-like [Hibiscus syriacus]
MGCWYSRIDREESVSRCKARKGYIKQLVKARQALAASHSMYLRSLRATGSALVQFSSNETTLHNHHHHAPPAPQPPPLPQPPMSPSSDTWTSGITTASPALPPPPPSSSWDFWDPFAQANASRSVTEEEWEVATSASEAAVTAASVAAPPSVVSGTFSKDTGSELAMVVSRNTKELVEIVKEVDEYFLKAADAGSHLSLLLEVSNSNFSAQSKGGKVYNYGCNLTPTPWTWNCNQRTEGIGKLGEDKNVGNTSGNALSSSHCSTIERLYAWEKKLYQEVKNAEAIKIEHEKKVAHLRKLEVKRADHMKIEKTKKEVEKLESQMMVASQATETTSAEIIRLRESELYPQLLELVKGLMCMWRSMYEIHQVHTHIVQQLKYLNFIPSNEPTSEIHRQSTLQLELEVQQWHLSFCNLVKAQRDYIQSLAGWLRLSLFQFSKSSVLRNSQESKIYSFCEEWHLAVDRIPDKVASDGIKSFLTVIHAIVVQQAEEYKRKKKTDSAFKDFEKKAAELRSLESKYSPYSVLETNKDPVAEKRTKVDLFRAKAEEENNKHEKSVSVTRAMTLNNLQMGFPHVFQAMVGFSSVCMQAFESVYNQAKSIEQEHDVKRILPN